MKHLLLSALLLGLSACSSDADPAPAPDATVTEAEASDGTAFGDPVPSGEALTADALLADAESYAGTSVVVEGTVHEVCQMAGCWLTMTTEAGETVRIDVPRDESESYVYTFPKDISGRTVRIAGMLELKTESVDDLRHYAEDRGDSPEAIEAITEPRQTLVLTARGAELTDAPSEADASA